MALACLAFQGDHSLSKQRNYIRYLPWRHNEASTSQRKKTKPGKMNRRLRAVLFLDSSSTSAASCYAITEAPLVVQVERQAVTASAGLDLSIPAV